jgi:ATP-binding cassette subfamily C (CFTR/MRP) protein 1
MAALTGILYILTFFRALSLYLPLLDSCKMIHNIALKGLSFTYCLFFDKNPTGRMLNRFGTDIATMDGFLVINTVEALFLIIFIIGNYIAAMIINKFVTIVFLIAVIYFILMGRYFSVASRKLKRFEQITKSPILTLINSSIHGLVTIRSQNIQKKLKRDLRKAIEVNYKTFTAHRLLMRTIQEYFDFGPQFLSILNIIILVLLRDSLEPGLAGMSISLTTERSRQADIYLK